MHLSLKKIRSSPSASNCGYLKPAPRRPISLNPKSPNCQGKKRPRSNLENAKKAQKRRVPPAVALRNRPGGQSSTLSEHEKIEPTIGHRSTFRKALKAAKRRPVTKTISRFGCERCTCYERRPGSDPLTRNPTMVLHRPVVQTSSSNRWGPQCMWASDNRSHFRVDGGKLFAFVAMNINHCLEIGARAWHGVGLLFLRGMLPRLSGPMQNPTK